LRRIQCRILATNAVVLSFFLSIAADMSKALLCSVNNQDEGWSVLYKLFGDPEQVVPRLNSGTANYHVNEITNYDYDYDLFHAVAVDYSKQYVYYADNRNGQGHLNYGLMVYNNDTSIHQFSSSPSSQKVRVAASFLLYLLRIAMMNSYRYDSSMQLQVSNCLWCTTFS